MISTISAISPAYSNASAPVALPGREPVSEEGRDLKASVFKTLEQSADSARGENRRSPDDHPNDVGEQVRLREDRIGSEKDRREQRTRKQPPQQDEAHDKKVEQEQQSLIRELATRDREVRAHEQAHAAIGGQYAGSPIYEFVRGPDGINYAVGGEVKISVNSIAGDPEATIAKAQQLRRAAIAPAEPSEQDRSIAVAATRMEIEAKFELHQQRVERRQQEAAIKREMVEARQVEAAKKEEALVSRQAEWEQMMHSNRAGNLQDASRPQIDINRRLMDIGVTGDVVTSGTLLDSRA